MNKRTTTATAALLAAALAATSCTGGTAESLDSTSTTTTATTTSVLADPVLTESGLGEAALVDTVSLSQADRDGLAFMREEEKLAGDVYQAMYDAWGLQIFDNIAAAERTHTQAVLDLLDRYGLPDPAEGLGRGEFSNSDLQALYDELVQTGSQSLTDALEVGALIEELDITDLRLRASDQPDIDSTYATLERGSRNHLRAFNRQLERQGISYTPDYLDQATFDQIVDTTTERGRSGR